MGMPVVTVASGGLPVGDMTGTGKGGMPVTECTGTNKFGVAITKVSGGGGMPVVFETIGGGGGGAASTTWNAADKQAMDLTNSNLTTTSNNFPASVRSVKGYNSGKFYFEIRTTTWASNDFVGMALGTASLSNVGGTGTAGVQKTFGTILVNGSGAGPTLGNRANGDIIGIAVDLDADLAWFRAAPSGNWNGSGTANPATGAGGINISALVGTLFPNFGTPNTVGSAATANFGASAFSGTVPAGFTSGWPA